MKVYIFYVLNYRALLQIQREMKSAMMKNRITILSNHHVLKFSNSNNNSLVICRKRKQLVEKRKVYVHQMSKKLLDSRRKPVDPPRPLSKLETAPHLPSSPCSPSSPCFPSSPCSPASTRPPSSPRPQSSPRSPSSSPSFDLPIQPSARLFDTFLEVDLFCDEQLSMKNMPYIKYSYPNNVNFLNGIIVLFVFYIFIF